MDLFQMIPLVMLGAYLLYCSYYYATPMFFLKVMIFLAHIRYRDIEIRVDERSITVRLFRDGEERVAQRPVDEELESRFWPMTVCSEFRRLLADIRKGTAFRPGDCRDESGETEAV